jgi:hypothetical protein
VRGGREPLDRLDLAFSTARIAHEAIFDRHGELAALGADDDHTRELLGESARIALDDLVGLTTGARRLAARWDERSLLEHAEAAETLRALRAELERIEPDLSRLRLRQQQISSDLRLRLTEARGR